MNKIAILGVGNPFRADDGIGWYAIDLLNQNNYRGIAFHKIAPDALEILSFFEIFHSIYLLDASVFSEKQPFIRYDATEELLPTHEKNTSSHSLGLSTAIELARALAQIPKKVIIYAIKANNFTIGAPPSSLCKKYAAQAIEQLQNEKDILLCMKKK